jgi:TonB family protein
MLSRLFTLTSIVLAIGALLSSVGISVLAQNSGPPPVQFDSNPPSPICTMGPGISPYFKAIRKFIAANWRGPTDSQRGPVVQFNLHPDGTTTDLLLLESSGNAELDKESMKRLSQLRFDPYPDWFRDATKGQTFTLRIDLKTGQTPEKWAPHRRRQKQQSVK